MQNTETFLTIFSIVLLLWNLVNSFFIYKLKVRLDKSIPNNLDYKLDLLVRATAKHEMFIDSVQTKAKEMEVRRKLKVR